VTVRAVSLADASAVALIYGHHVLRGTATFDTVPLTEAETHMKIEAIVAKASPFLVAEQDGVVIGYAYAKPFRDRAAYASTCEDSIYVHPDYIGKGVGRTLLAALLDAAEERGLRQMIAVVGGGEPASIALHAEAGFEQTGRMRSVGRKFGRWLDTVYMQRQLDVGDAAAPEGELE
jgi:L-amino acid N-acyltransferase YncA